MNRLPVYDEMTPLPGDRGGVFVWGGMLGFFDPDFTPPAPKAAPAPKPVPAARQHSLL
jgi:hypothetical protein